MSPPCIWLVPYTLGVRHEDYRRGPSGFVQRPSPVRRALCFFVGHRWCVWWRSDPPAWGYECARCGTGLPEATPFGDL